jgi:hypothetical protein
VKRHPIVAYFVLTFTISWLGALAVAAPSLLRGESLPQMTGILMFPAMLLGPSVSGIFLTVLLEGKKGLREMFSRMSPSSVQGRWWTALLIPPMMVLTVLVLMAAFVSPVQAEFLPHRNPVRNSGGVSGRDRLDRFCAPANGIAQCVAGAVVVGVALAGD